MTKLISRPFPNYDESLISYTHRVCMANCLTESQLNSYLELVLGDNTKKPYSHPRDFQIALAKVTDKQDVKVLLNLRLLSEAMLKHVRRESFSICVECMKKEPYHRDIWLFREYTVCQEHGGMMLDACPECGSGLKFPTLLSMQCPNDACKASFANVQSTCVGDARFSRKLSEQFERRYSHASAFTRVLADSLDMFEDINPALLLADPTGALHKEWQSRRSLSVNRIHELLAVAEFADVGNLSESRRKMCSYYQFHTDRSAFSYKDMYARFRKWLSNDKREWVVDAYLWGLLSGNFAKISESEISLDILGRLLGIEQKNLLILLQERCPKGITKKRGGGSAGSEALRCIGLYMCDQGDERFQDLPV